MKITEKALLDGYDGHTNDGDLISVIRGKEVRWTYRKGRDPDGYNCVSTRVDAGEITLEWDRVGRIPLEKRCENHPALARIAREEAEMWGDQIA